jgi:iron complex outermembrane receptor protein
MSPKHFSKLALPLCVAAGSALLAGSAVAQEDLTDLGLEEMVVTAQKREENLQAVPISISALSATDIERRGVHNSADLVSTMPNMGGFISPGSRGDLSITLRGVAGAAPSNLSNDPGVAIYIDGVILGKQVGNSLDVAELERVEVLRRPQGTLYGRNSTGGAVNFIAKKPSGDSGGHSLIATWNFEDLGALGNVEFKSISGSRKQDTRNFGDLDGVDNTLAPGGACMQDANYAYLQFSQELQMDGSTERVQYALGYYGCN